MSRKSPPPETAPFPWKVLVVAVLLLGAVATFIALRKSPAKAPANYAAGEITYGRHVAPIIHRSCAGCHREGQPAPFPLLTYADVKKHARDIQAVVQNGYMPPWPPVGGHGRFLGDRSLPAEEIGLLNQWIEEGAAEGNPAEHPAAPQWSTDWQLGPPDLVVTMPQAYSVWAEGRDIYRNFVVPVPLTAPRYVRAIEFRPGNARVVHHTLIKVDSSGESRRRDAVDVEPGFPGMIVPTETGHFLGWQPGRGPTQAPNGMPWQIKPGSDLVLQMHLSPSGKTESVQPSVAFYFTDQPPAKTPFRILLTSVRMDMPAGVANYPVEDSYNLPVDVHLHAILPHAHYLGKEVHAWATLPDGRTETLIQIRNWDFNWQSDYQYANPVFLPKGTRLAMRFIYDNSTNNVRNPSHPPRPARYGPESTDEMAELWLQVVPRNPQELSALQRDYESKARQRFFEGNVFLANRNPPDREAMSTLGVILLTQGNMAEAERYLTQAVSLDDKNTRAFYGLGLLHRRLNRLPQARQAFERAIALDPANYQAHANLGYVCLGLSDPGAAEAHFARALQLNSGDPLALEGLRELRNPTSR